MRVTQNRLAEARRKGVVENDDFENEMEEITSNVGKLKPATFNEDDWVDEVGLPKRPRVKRKKIRRSRKG